MTRALIILGILVFSLPWAASAQSILEKIEHITLGETMDAGTELDVQRYLPLILKGRLWHPVTEADVDVAVEQGEELLCASWDESQGNCLTTKEIAHQARRAAWHRTLARDLQLITAEHETNMVGLSGEQNPLETGLPGILNIWQSGVDEMTNPIVSREPKSPPIDLTDAEEEIESVRSALRQLTETGHGKNSNRLLAAAVFRYRHGLKAVIRAEGGCDENVVIENDMELLAARFCPLESALHSLAALVASMEDTTILKPLKFNDVLVWLRQDDIGLQWEIALEPVMPTLQSRVSPSLPRLGGTYPEDIREPKLLEGICSHPIGARGYLCRAVQSTECPVTRGEARLIESAAEAPVGQVREDNDGNLWIKKSDDLWHQQGVPSPAPTLTNSEMDIRTKRIVSGAGGMEADLEITLIECLPYNLKSDVPIHITESGPDICTTGGWRMPLDYPMANFGDGPYLDPQCQTCTPDIFCVNDEPLRSSSSSSSSSVASASSSQSSRCVTGEYDEATGRIKVCVNQRAGLPAKYIMAKELVVAQQLCGRSDREAPQSGPGCCGLQWYPSLVACKQIAEDGKFENTEITVLECAAELTNAFCDGDCAPDLRVSSSWSSSSSSSSSVDTEYKPTPLLEKILDAVSGSEYMTCTEIRADLPASDQIVASIVASFPVSCSPNCKVQYENTIGNNLCYIGQCVEQVMEGSRLVPGRLTFNSGDEAYPWEGCIEPDVQNGAYIELPPAHIPYVPEYKGYELVRAADLAVCQVNGYPPLTPPVLCLSSPARQLLLPLENVNAQVTGFQSQSDEQAFESYIVQAETASLGVRGATNLYEEFMSRSVGEFGTLINIATTLIKQIGETEWPIVMCPRYNTQGCSLFQSL